MEKGRVFQRRHMVPRARGSSLGARLDCGEDCVASANSTADSEAETPSTRTVAGAVAVRPPAGGLSDTRRPAAGERCVVKIARNRPRVTASRICFGCPTWWRAGMCPL